MQQKTPVDLTCQTGAAVVTYNPDEAFLERLRALKRILQSVAVVDNSNQLSTQTLVAKICSKEGVRLIRNGGNLGVARALNIALHWAEKEGHRWLLTLDQDSFPHTDLMLQYAGILSDAGSESRIGCVGVLLGKQADHCRKKRQSYCDVDDVITSGTLLSVAAAREAGGFWDELFIDGVDTEMCIRLRRTGFRVIGTVAPVLTHSIGAGRAVSILGRRLLLTDHPPVRRYYMARNRVLVSRRHGVPIGWYGIFRDGVLGALVEPGGFAKVSATLAGLIAGFRSAGVPGSREKPPSSSHS